MTEYKRVFSFLLDLAFPPECIICDQPVGKANSLCIDCWNGIEFISDPVCDQCGKPMEYYADFETHERILCFECLASPSKIYQARAAMIYGETSKKLLLLLKYTDRIHLAKILAPMTLTSAKDIIKTADIIIPVPLHPQRLFQRKYNQASMLAKHIGKLASVPVLFNTLKRHKNTFAQGNMNKCERDLNVHNAFSIDKQDKHKIKNRKILLVDDVRTTGSTAEECAKVLLKNKAKQVNLLTIARTVSS